MIEAAALMALVVGDWGNLTIITSLLLFNALLGLWKERDVSNALDALIMSYVLYRIAMTIAIIVFAVLASIYYHFFPLTGDHAYRARSVGCRAYHDYCIR